MKNQCDGCQRGLPLENGIHRARGTSYDMIGCTRELYDDTEDAAIVRMPFGTVSTWMFDPKDIKLVTEERDGAGNLLSRREQLSR